MRKTFIIFFLALPFLAFSQYQVFQLKDQKYYSERNKFLKDSLWRFNQIIKYDVPRSIDEESWIRLTLEVKDTTKFINLKKLDVNKDTAMLYYHFASFNSWTVLQDTSSIVGNVLFVSEKPEGITLRLDLIVTNLKDQRTYIYKGERTFKRAVNIQDFYD